MVCSFRLIFGMLLKSQALLLQSYLIHRKYFSLYISLPVFLGYNVIRGKHHKEHKHQVKMHFYFNYSITATGFTTAAFYIKTEPAFLKPRTFASFVEANKSRMSSNTPVYVAGFERGVRPIGD